MSGEDGGMELLVPFVVCDDNGGPFAAADFTAGFEMGEFWMQCAAMTAIGRPSMRRAIRRDNLPQADLIAMHFNMECLEEPTPEALGDAVRSEWAYVIFGFDIIDDTADEATP